MVKDVGTYTILLPLDLTPVAVVSLPHGLGGLPSVSVLCRAQTTGHHTHTVGGLAGIVSLDPILSLGLCCRVHLSFHPPQHIQLQRTIIF
jgi:hypothetical protein